MQSLCPFYHGRSFSQQKAIWNKIVASKIVLDYIDIQELPFVGTDEPDRIQSMRLDSAVVFTCTANMTLNCLHLYQQPIAQGYNTPFNHLDSEIQLLLCCRQPTEKKN